MADYQPLPLRAVDEQSPDSKPRSKRVASLDVFRGLSVFIMIIVDYAGGIFPIIDHCPWNGVHLADFVLPFFLFIVGISISIVHKNQTNRVEATWKTIRRSIRLFLLGVFLQGGYFHSRSLTFGIDIKKLRWLGVLQRISIGYAVASLTEIWLPNPRTKKCCFSWHWFLVIALSAVHSALLYGIHVPAWRFKTEEDESHLLLSNRTSVYNVECSVRGDLGPACNAAGMIDRLLLGADHLHKRPTYRRLKACIKTQSFLLDRRPPWCLAPFEPEGILSSIMASAACIIGLQYGRILTRTADHRKRLYRWSAVSMVLMTVGLVVALLGVPLNKPLYTVSFTAVTSGTAGITFASLYVLVDVYGWKRLTWPFTVMGKHSLSIFILVTSNVIIMLFRGFYLSSPHNNLVDWVISHVVGRS